MGCGASSDSTAIETYGQAAPAKEEDTSKMEDPPKPHDVNSNGAKAVQAGEKDADGDGEKPEEENVAPMKSFKKAQRKVRTHSVIDINFQPSQDPASPTNRLQRSKTMPEKKFDRQSIDNKILRRRRLSSVSNSSGTTLHIKELANEKKVYDKDSPPPQSLIEGALKSAYEAVKVVVDSDATCISLPRGGIYVRTSVGPVQFGIPPETIKDCMALGLKLPRYYIVPRERFDRHAGISVSEFEFPTYFNFFVMRGRINLVTFPEDEALIRRVFQETLFGPVDANEFLEVECRSPEARQRMPNLQKELDYFRRNPFKPTERMEIDTVMNFIHFSDDGVSNLTDEEGNNVSVKITDESYEVYDNDLKIASIPDVVALPNMVDEEENSKVLTKNFVVPRFGSTFMGTSHGFDPHGTTTGFVLWINKRGVMVDPPPNSASLLRSEGIPAHLIDTVILTHCHADHDAGTFQKLLDEQRIRVVTTPTIMNSFLRKYSAMSGLDINVLLQLFNYQPVGVDEAYKVHGATFRFFYTLHAIPCMAFEVNLEGKRIVYSGDTYYDKDRVAQLCEEGHLSEGRRDALTNFPWDCDVVLHEAGVPPIHTPAATLAAMSEDVKERLYCVHVSAKDFPFDKGLKIAACGVENTVTVDVGPCDPARSVIDLICGIDIFKSVQIDQATTIVGGYRRVDYKAGEVVVEAGQEVVEFLVVESGVLIETQPDGSQPRNITLGDYYGEKQLITGMEADVNLTAAVDCTLVVFSREDFLCIVRSTDLYTQVMRVMESKLEDSHDVIAKNSVFSNMSDKQKAQLQRLLEIREIKKGAALFKKGESATTCVLIKSGCLTFDTQTVEPFRMGTFIGHVDQVLNRGGLNLPFEATVIAMEDSVIYEIKNADMELFFLNNPGVLLKLINTIFME